MRTAARYSVAVIATVVALLLTSALAELVSPMRLFFFWCAVLLTAVVSGLGPAVLAITLSVVGSAFLVFPPMGSFAIRSSTDVVRVAMFVVFAGGISIIAAMRRTAVSRARVSEMRYRTLIEATPSPQAVWTATADGRIQWSDAWTAITGQSREELESGGGLSAVHPEDGARTWQRWSAALVQKTFYEDEIRVRVAGGRYRWFAIRAVPLQIDEDRHEWVGIIADIHSRKRNEETTSFINQASEVLSSSLGFEQTMRNLARLCVPAIADSCAVDVGADETYERIVVEHVDPTHIELIREFDRRTRLAAAENHPVVRVLKSGETDLREEVTDEMVSALGAGDPELAQIARTLNVRSSVVAPMRARGRSLGALSLVYNNSGRRYSEEDLPLIEELARRAAMALDNARLYEAAEAANRAKDEFLATLSHELRTPLTAISGWAHMLKLGITDEQTSAVAIDTIIRSAKAQGELIDDLLDLSRVVAGTLHLNITSVDFGQLVQEVVAGLGPAADAKELMLEFAPPERVLLVRADDRRLRQIVWNLLTNAVKFTDRGGRVRIALSARGHTARLEVSDTGRGIDAAFLPYVWDRFRQADSSTSREHGGLGLGLAVVRHLVELHGGTVEVVSEGIGRGATFAVDLPLARVGEDTAARRGREDADLLRDRTILVVDDADDARLLLAALLRQFGAEVVTASSVEQAVAQFDAGTFDAVVSDIAMPGEDGFSLARRIRAVSDVPLIAVSAIASGPEDRTRALDAGFADFIPKPVDATRLAATVSASLR